MAKVARIFLVDPPLEFTEEVPPEARSAILEWYGSADGPKPPEFTRERFLGMLMMPRARVEPVHLEWHSQNEICAWTRWSGGEIFIQSGDKWEQSLSRFVCIEPKPF